LIVQIVPLNHIAPGFLEGVRARFAPSAGVLASGDNTLPSYAALVIMRATVVSASAETSEKARSVKL
jgi:hypothetical protein